MSIVDHMRVETSESALRKELASRPVAEKLRMLDQLRERALILRKARLSS